MFFPGSRRCSLCGIIFDNDKLTIAQAVVIGLHGKVNGFLNHTHVTAPTGLRK